MGARPNKHDLSFYLYTFHIWKMFSPCSKLKRIDITHSNIRLSKPKINQSPRFTKTNCVGFEGKISNLSSTTTPSKIQFPCWEVLSFWSLITADDITVYVYEKSKNQFWSLTGGFSKSREPIFDPEMGF